MPWKNRATLTRVLQASALAASHAPALPCEGCGAALPADPTAPHVWCRMCHVWRSVPAELQRRAWEHQRALSDVYAAAANARAQGEAHRIQAQSLRQNTWIGYAFLGFMLFTGLVTFIPTLVVYGAAVVTTAAEELEPWAAALVLSATLLSGLVTLLAVVGAIWGIYRRLTRNRRARRQPQQPDWFGAQAAGGDVATAVCGMCGAPIGFRLGDQTTSCGYCRSIVIATPAHARRLLGIALTGAQLERLQAAKRERDKLRAELSASRHRMVLQAYMFAGSMVLIALPVAGAVYAWRMLTHSIEEDFARLASQIKGEFSGGLDGAFDWLDAYWIGDTPAGFRQLQALQSRWSVDGVFHGRPLLLSATTSWSDRVATRTQLLLARPRQRNVRAAAASAAADQARALGFGVETDYAGVVLEATNLRELAAERVTTLARLAYEIAEEG